MIEVGFGKAEGGEGEVGIFLGGQAEGIEVGESVTEGAVSEEKIIDAGLGENIACGGGEGGGGVGAGGGMELATEFESFEKSAPGGVNRGGVYFPGLVKFFEKGGVAWVSDSAEGGGRSGGRTIGVEAIESGEEGIGLWVRGKITNHDEIDYFIKKRVGRVFG